MKWRLQIAALLAVILLFSLYSFRNKQAVIATPFTASSLPITYLDTHQSDLLKKYFPKAAAYRVTQHTEPLVILAQGNSADTELYTKAQNIVARGHHVLVFGTSPFARATPWRAGMWKHIKNPPDWQPDTTIDSISDIPLWETHAQGNQSRSHVSLIRTNWVAFPLFQIDFQQVDQRAWIRRRIEDPAENPDQTIEFMCRSSLRGQPFLIQVSEPGRATYQCIIPASKDWQWFRLTPEAFISVETGASLKTFSNTREWAIGFDQKTLRFPVGDQAVELSPFFQGPPMDSAYVNTHPFPLAGGGKTYSGKVVHFQNYKQPGWQSKHAPCPAAFPFPLLQGESSPLITPLIQGRSPEGHRVPVVVQVRYPETSSGSWIWAGLDISNLSDVTLIELIEDIAQASQPDATILNAYPDNYSVRFLEPIHLNVLAKGLKTDAVSCRIHAELETLDGRSLGSLTTEPFLMDVGSPPVHTNLTLNGISPVDTAKTDYRVSVSLEYGEGNLNYIDQRRLRIKILPEPPKVDSRMFLRPNVNVFRVGRNTFQIHGMTYSPGQVDIDTINWLSPADFSEAVIRKDLTRLRQAGINTLRIPCPSIDTPHQLRYLLQEVYRSGFLVILKLPYLDRSSDLPQLVEFLKDAGIPDSPHVVALEIDTHFLNSSKTLADIHNAWSHWLEEQFGSVEIAVGAMGANRAAPPSAAQMRDPNTYPHPTLLQAFRNDWVSRTVGYLTRSLRPASLHQMITALTSTDLYNNLPDNEVSGFDVRALAPHVDYLTLSAAFGYGEKDKVLGGTALAVLARGLSGGKPVVWDQITCGLAQPSSKDMLEFQQLMHSWGLELARQSHAAGSIGSQYADYGKLLHNAGIWGQPLTSRPALTPYTQHGNLLRSRRPVPRPWKEKTFSMDPRGGDIIHAWNELKTICLEETQANHLQERRHTLFRIPSTQATVQRLMKTPTAPLSHVNAEWGSINLQGDLQTRMPGTLFTLRGRDPIKLKLINTGAASWSASVKDQINTVWVEIRHENLQPKYLEVPKSNFGDQIDIVWHPHGYGTFTLRPMLWATGGFGEVLKVDVTHSEP